uniref:Cyclin C-terminal domain-containing protein n=1 Tax=Aegilops tauschii subsp. strangulata TaxID=200361 RepID=A0A453IPG9_AEGTS
MEADILKYLNFQMGSPTIRTFLLRFLISCRGGNVSTFFKPSAVASLNLSFVTCFPLQTSVCKCEKVGAYVLLSRGIELARLRLHKVPAISYCCCLSVLSQVHNQPKDSSLELDAARENGLQGL